MALIFFKNRVRTTVTFMFSEADPSSVSCLKRPVAFEDVPYLFLQVGA